MNPSIPNSVAQSPVSVKRQARGGVLHLVVYREASFTKGYAVFLAIRKSTVWQRIITEPLLFHLSIY